MKPSRSLTGGLGGLLVATSTSAFQISRPGYAVIQTKRLEPLAVSAATDAFFTVNIQENGERDVFSMQEWARNCGAQTTDGFELTSQDGHDWSVITNQDLAAGSPVLFVPAHMILSSSAAEEEFGGNLEASETALAEYEDVTDRLPLFRLMVKILAEYELGDQSPYFLWLNSLPRWFSNGVAMTDACFECLPPYVSWLSMKERNTFSQFLNALRQGYAPLSEQTINDDNLIRWAYNVALTRHDVVVEGQEKKVAPMADMFNHGTVPNARVTYDMEGNCLVSTIQDVPAGSPLTISLGDPTDPSPLFAKYGFLSHDCTSIFCKAVHLLEEMEYLGYDFKDLLFSTETGELAPKVWDLFLYGLLSNGEDENLRRGFLEACRSGDEGTKRAYHEQYFPFTLEALREHVNGILREVDSLTVKANSYDVRTHPRIPVIVAHNDLVKRTFLKVKAQLDVMG